MQEKLLERDKNDWDWKPLAEGSLKPWFDDDNDGALIIMISSFGIKKKK